MGKELDFKISLADYSRETPQSIVAQLLERARAAEVVADVINNEVRPYLARHHITDESSLFVYLQELMTGVNGLAASCLSDSAWELKALAVIDCIHDINVRVDATLELMRRASVPPSEGLATLIDQALIW